MTADQLAEVREAAVVAVNRHPALVANGFRIPNLGYECSNRPLLDGSTGTSEMATAIAFLRLCTKTTSASYSSYALKHAAEDWGGANDMSPYVSNGALIAAAVYLQFVIKPIPLSPNASIGVSRKSLRALMTPLLSRYRAVYA